MYVMMQKIFEKVQKEFGSRMYDFTLVPLSLLCHFPSLPLEVSPLEVWGSAVSSPSGVWGRAPAKIEFGAF